MDQLYFESGYITDGYYTVVREAAAGLNVSATFTVDGIIAVTTGYFIDDYITVGYFVVVGEVKQAEAVFSATVTSTATVTRIIESSVALTAAFAPTLTAEGIKNSTAVLDSVSTMTVDAVANKAANILLEHIANLNAQAAKTAVIDSTMATTATVSAQANHSVVSSATFASTTTVTCVTLKLKITSANVSSIATFYAGRLIRAGRPRPYTQVGTPTLDTGSKKFGAASARLNYTNHITVPASSDWSRIKTVDFWFNIPNPTEFDDVSGGFVHPVLTWHTDSNNRRSIRFTSQNQGIKFGIIGASYSANIAGVNYYHNLDFGSGISYNTWRHFRLLDDGSAITMWLDGVKQNPVSTNYTSAGIGYNQTLIIGHDPVFNPPTIRIDELLITRETLTSSATSTFTIPSDRWYPEDQTKILLLSHFDSDYTDDIGEWMTPTLALSSNATITTQANPNTKQAAASLASTVSATVNADGFRSATATLSSAFTVSATIGTLEDAVSLKVSAVTLTADNVRVRYFESVENSAFTPSITVIATKVGETTLSFAFTISVNANSFTDVSAALSSQFNIVIDAVKSITASSALTSQATIYANGGYPIDSGSISLSSAAGFALTAIVFEGTGIAVSVTATMSVTAQRLRGIVAQPSGTFTLTSEVRENPPAFQVSDYQIFPTDFSASFQWQFPSNVPNSNDELIDASFSPPNIFNNVGSGLSIAYNNGNGDDYVFVNVAYLKRVGTDQYQLYTREAQYGIAASVTNALSTFTYRSFSVNVTAINQSTGAFTITASFPMATISSTTAESVFGTYNIRILNNPDYVFAPVDINNLPSNNIQNVSYSRLGQVYYLVYPQIASADLVSIPFATLTAAPITVVFLTVGLLASSGTMSTSGVRIAGGNANVTSTVTVNANAGLQAAATAQFTTAVTVSASASRTRNTSSNLTAVSDLTCAGSRVRFANSSIASAATTLITAQKITDITVSVDTTVTQTATIFRIQRAQADITAFNSQLTAAFKNATGTVLLETQSQMQITAEKNAVGLVAVAAQFTQSTDTADAKTVRMSAAVSAQFTQSTQGDRIQPAGSAMASAFTQSTNTANSKTTRVTADFTVTATQTAQAERFRDGIALQASLGTLTCANNRLRQASSAMSAVIYDFTASPTFIVRITANFTAFNTQLTVGEVINIDPYLTLMITAETRGLRILPENREITIDSETRVNII